MLNVKNIFGPGRAESGRLPAREAFSRRSSETRLGIARSTPDRNLQSDVESVSAKPADLIPVWAGAPSVLKLEHILLPFDFSAASVQLLRWLISFAERVGAKLTLLHVVSPRMSPTGQEASHPHDANEERLKTGRVLLERVLKSVCKGHEPVCVHVVVGHPTEEILRLAGTSKPDVIIMATHGPRVLKHLFLSATTERVTRQAQCPVLIVPEAVLARRNRTDSQEAQTKTRQIVVPTDLSSNSAAALRFAGTLAEAQGARLNVLNFAGSSAQTPRARPCVKKWIQSNLPLVSDLTMTVCEAEASVYMLVRQAELLNADLIVLGPRGYAWTERRRLHSTTDGILRNASCPVLSLRAGTYPAWR